MIKLATLYISLKDREGEEEQVTPAVTDWYRTVMAAKAATKLLEQCVFSQTVLSWWIALITNLRITAQMITYKNL